MKNKFNIGDYVKTNCGSKGFIVSIHVFNDDEETLYYGLDNHSDRLKFKEDSLTLVENLLKNKNEEIEILKYKIEVLQDQIKVYKQLDLFEVRSRDTNALQKENKDLKHENQRLRDVLESAMVQIVGEV